MSDQHNPHSEQYERARREFEDLKLEDRAVFLLEATIITIARGVDEIGRFLAKQVDDLFKAGEEAAKEEEKPTPPDTTPPVDLQGM